MKFSKAKLWFMFTIILGLITSMVITNYLKGLEKTAAKEVSTVPTVMTTVKIAQGTKLTQEMVKVVQVASEYVPKNAVSDIQDAIGKFAIVDLSPEEYLLADKVATENTNEMPYRIPEGKRAFTIAINPVSGVAGFVKPGHLVDLLLNFEISGKPEGKKVATMLQSIKVLAVGPDLVKKDGVQPAETITVAVTPKDAELLMLAEVSGKIKLVLRPSGDSKTTKVDTVNLKQLQEMYK